MQEKYKIELINLNQLDWKWYWPKLWTKGFERENNFNVKRYTGWKENVKNPNWNPKYPKEKIFKSIFESIKSEGMKNPLIVGPYIPDRYIVIVGNQRLAIFRALDEMNLLTRPIMLKCIIEPDSNYWDTDWPPARKECPYG